MLKCTLKFWKNRGLRNFKWDLKQAAVLNVTDDQERVNNEFFILRL